MKRDGACGPVSVIAMVRAVSFLVSAKTRGRLLGAAVALEVGYDSEAAFSRAFKKIAGASPAAWRNRRLDPAPAR
jgi:transcriptional regulator GlxA family with amidase domain